MRSYPMLVAVLSMLTFGGVWLASTPATVPAGAMPARDVHYAGCDAVRAAGAAPLLRGQPGYRADMDGDDDGIACEPHRDDRSGWPDMGSRRRSSGRRR